MKFSLFAKWLRHLTALSLHPIPNPHTDKLLARCWRRLPRLGRSKSWCGPRAALLDASSWIGQSYLWISCVLLIFIVLYFVVYLFCSFLITLSCRFGVSEFERNWGQVLAFRDDLDGSPLFWKPSSHGWLSNKWITCQHWDFLVSGFLRNLHTCSTYLAKLFIVKRLRVDSPDWISYLISHFPVYLGLLKWILSSEAHDMSQASLVAQAWRFSQLINLAQGKLRFELWFDIFIYNLKVDFQNTEEKRWQTEAQVKDGQPIYKATALLTDRLSFYASQPTHESNHSDRGERVKSAKAFGITLTRDAQVRVHAKTKNHRQHESRKLAWPRVRECRLSAYGGSSQQEIPSMGVFLCSELRNHSCIEKMMMKIQKLNFRSVRTIQVGLPAWNFRFSSTNLSFPRTH